MKNYNEFQNWSYQSDEGLTQRYYPMSCAFDPFLDDKLDEQLDKYFIIGKDEGHISLNLKHELYANTYNITRILISLGYLSEDTSAEDWDIELDQAIQTLMFRLEEYLNNNQCHKSSKICIRYILSIFDQYFDDIG